MGELGRALTSLLHLLPLSSPSPCSQQIPTISYDDNGSPTEDPRWKPFYDFQDWLEETFPAVFQSSHVTLEKVNHLGILTTVQGSDKTLKPLLLLSHYDVTPAPLETFDRWTVSKLRFRNRIPKRPS